MSVDGRGPVLAAAIAAGGSSCQSLTRASVAPWTASHARCSCGMRLQAGATSPKPAQIRGPDAVLQGWPTEQQLLALMRTRPGEAVAYQVCARRQMWGSGHYMPCAWSARQLLADMQDGPAAAQHSLCIKTTCVAGH